MVCAVCSLAGGVSNCTFLLEDALENIKNHYEYYKKALYEKEKQVNDLQQRNMRLLKAVEVFKKTEMKSPINSQHPEQRIKRSHKTHKEEQTLQPIFNDEIAYITDNDEETGSVMDTALNGTALNSSNCLSEDITETENPTFSRCKSSKKQIQKSKHFISKNTMLSTDNDENKKPSAVSVLNLIISPKPNLAPRVSIKSNKNKLTQNVNAKNGLNSLQTRLKFDESLKKRIVGGTKPNLSLTLGKKTVKNLGANTVQDDKDFDNNATSTFCFNDPLVSKSNLFGEDFVSDIVNTSNLNSSVVVLSDPTPTLIFLDDTSNEVTQKFSKSNARNLRSKKISAKEKESHAAKEHLKVNTTIVDSIYELPKFHIKEAPKTQITRESQKFPINSIFAYKESREEIDDEFGVSPIPIKEEKNESFDIRSKNCENCRKFVKFCGNNINRRKFLEQISKCAHNQENDCMSYETPHNYWNPLMLSFAENDPRNEILVDSRFVHKKHDTNGEKM